MDSQQRPLPGLVRDESQLRLSIRQHLGHVLSAFEELHELEDGLQFNDQLDREVMEAVLSDRAVREGGVE